MGKIRVGAYCMDGTYSTATGRGACSWHGGVKEWDQRQQYIPKPYIPKIYLPKSQEPISEQSIENVSNGILTFIKVILFLIFLNCNEDLCYIDGQYFSGITPNFVLSISGWILYFLPFESFWLLISQIYAAYLVFDFVAYLWTQVRPLFYVTSAIFGIWYMFSGQSQESVAIESTSSNSSFYLYTTVGIIVLVILACVCNKKFWKGLFKIAMFLVLCFVAIGLISIIMQSNPQLLNNTRQKISNFLSKNTTENNPSTKSQIDNKPTQKIINTTKSKPVNTTRQSANATRNNATRNQTARNNTIRNQTTANANKTRPVNANTTRTRPVNATKNASATSKNKVQNRLTQQQQPIKINTTKLNSTLQQKQTQVTHTKQSFSSYINHILVQFSDFTFSFKFLDKILNTLKFDKNYVILTLNFLVYYIIFSVIAYLFTNFLDSIQRLVKIVIIGWLLIGVVYMMYDFKQKQVDLNNRPSNQTQLNLNNTNDRNLIVNGSVVDEIILSLVNDDTIIVSEDSQKELKAKVEIPVKPTVATAKKQEKINIQDPKKNQKTSQTIKASTVQKSTTAKPAQKQAYNQQLQKIRINRQAELSKLQRKQSKTNLY